METIPEPGAPVRGSRTGRPIMALFDLLGRKWTLRILWELRQGSFTFRGLQVACDNLSPTVLNRRLKELGQAGIIGQEPGKGYALTREGTELLALIAPLNAWSKRWEKRSVNEGDK